MSTIRFAALLAGTFALVAVTRHTATAATRPLVRASTTVTTPAPSATHGTYAVTLHIDNRTQWYIDVVVDGVNVGTVAPYGDLYEAVPSGSTRMSAVARFTDGSSTTWGPRYENLSGDFVWRLW
jgi:ABC-type glycerol-3-phosphate transport system substrate-binding protein